MLYRLFFILKGIIVTCLFIYAFDSLVLPLNFFIPLNFFTIFLIVFFDIPAFLGLIVFSFLF